MTPSPTLQTIFRTLNVTSNAGQSSESAGGASLAAVLCLLGLGLMGTVSNLGLLLAAIRPPLALPALPDPLASALANLAAAGLVESTVNASLSAYYASGGFSVTGSSASEAATTGKAVMLGSLATAAAGMAWSIAGVMAASLRGTSLSKVRLGAVAAWPVSVGLGVATTVVAKRNNSIIIETPVLPRAKLVNMHPALRYSLLALGFVMPWLLTTGLGIRRTYLTVQENKQVMSKSEDISKRSIPHDMLAVLGVLVQHVLLHLPFAVATLISGVRSSELHTVLAFGRFAHAAVAPVIALVPGGRLSVLYATFLRCCPRRPRPAVSPPPPAHPARALLRQVAMVQPRSVTSLPIYTPVIFPTPGGLFLRVPRPRGSNLTSPGFSYRNADVPSQSAAISELTRGSLERRDVFLRRF